MPTSRQFHHYHTLTITNPLTGNRYIHYYHASLSRTRANQWYHQHYPSWTPQLFRTTSPYPLLTND